MYSKRLHRLEAVQIKSLTKGMHHDGGGLYLQVIASGGRSWIYRQMVNGARRDWGLGGWPNCSLEMARIKAEKLKRSIFEEKKITSSKFLPSFKKTSFRAVVGYYLMEKYSQVENRRQQELWVAPLNKHIFPTIGDMPVGGIDSRDIFEAMERLWISKPVTARKILQKVGVILKWSQQNGYRLTGALDTIDEVKRLLPVQVVKSRPHGSMHYSQIPGFLRQLRVLQIDEEIKRAFEFLVLTSRQTSEVINVLVSDLDLKRRVWHLKQPGGNSYTLRVPLARKTVALLNDIKIQSGSNPSYLFRRSASQKPLNATIFLRTMRMMGINATVHGFRKSFMEWSLAQSTITQDVVRLALSDGKSMSKQSENFNHEESYKKRQDLMEAWAWFLN